MKPMEYCYQTLKAMIPNLDTRYINPRSKVTREKILRTSTKHILLINQSLFTLENFGIPYSPGSLKHLNTILLETHPNPRNVVIYRMNFILFFFKYFVLPMPRLSGSDPRVASFLMILSSES